MSSLFIFLLCCWGSLIINMWFYSDFFAYYAKALHSLLPQRFLLSQKIYNWLLVENYLNDQDPNYEYESYIEYLYIKRSFTKSFKTKFILKLLACPMCFTVWMSVLISIIMLNLWIVGLVFLILRLLDFILRFVLKKSI